VVFRFELVVGLCSRVVFLDVVVSAAVFVEERGVGGLVELAVPRY